MTTTKTYTQFKNNNFKEYDKFISKNVFFAFSENQFKKGLDRLGVSENAICCLNNGGYMLKSASNQRKQIIKKYYKNQRKYLSNFKNLLSALMYEMKNHECFYTGDLMEGVEALGFKEKDLYKNKKLQKAYNICVKNYYNN